MDGGRRMACPRGSCHAKIMHGGGTSRGEDSHDRLRFTAGTVGGEVAGFDSSAVANHVKCFVWIGAFFLPPC